MTSVLKGIFKEPNHSEKVQVKTAPRSPKAEAPSRPSTTKAAEKSVTPKPSEKGEPSKPRNWDSDVGGSDVGPSRTETSNSDLARGEKEKRRKPRKKSAKKSKNPTTTVGTEIRVYCDHCAGKGYTVLETGRAKCGPRPPGDVSVSRHLKDLGYKGNSKQKIIAKMRRDGLKIEDVIPKEQRAVLIKDEQEKKAEAAREKASAGQKDE